MKRRLLFVISLLLLGVFITSQPTMAQAAATLRTLPRGQQVLSDYFITGDTVNVSGVVEGDAYVAGGQVVVDGTIKGDLLVGGGTVTITGDIGQNVRVGGGNIVINGKIGRNLTVLAGNVNIGKGAVIGGSIVSVFGNMEYFGSSAKDVQFIGGNASINGVINGNFQAQVGQLTFGDAGRLTGKLTYTSKQEATFAPNATVSGEVVFTPAAVVPEMRISAKDGIKKFVVLWAGISAGLKTISFISALILGLVFTRLFPRRMAHAAILFQKDPWRCLGAGLLVLILMPITAFIFVLSIVGIPIGLLLFIVFMFYLYVGAIWLSFSMGRILLLRLGKGERRGWAMVVGLIIYFILTTIPFLGWLAKLLVTIAGAGMLFFEKREVYRMLTAKRIL